MSHSTVNGGSAVALLHMSPTEPSVVITKEQILRDGINRVIQLFYKNTMGFQQRALNTLALQKVAIQQHTASALVELERHCLENNNQHVFPEGSSKGFSTCAVCGAKYI